MRQSDEESLLPRESDRIRPGEDGKTGIIPDIMRTVIGLWVFSYWFCFVIVNPAAFGSTPPRKEAAPDKNFMTCMHNYWIWLLAIVYAGCMIFMCQSWRSPATPGATQYPSPFGACACPAFWTSCPVTQLAKWSSMFKTSCLGIVLCDRWLKIQDVVSDGLVIFCDETLPFCHTEGLWWGSDWWWAHLALFFTLNTVVVVWVVTAPIFIRQLDTVLVYRWLSLLVWIIFGMPFLVVLDVAMLLRFPFWTPRAGWLTEVLLLQKVAEATLEAPFQAALQCWIFWEKHYKEHRLDDEDDSSIPWMLIFSIVTSALTFVLTVADINSQAAKQYLSFKECLYDLLLVGLRQRAPLLHALPKQAEVSYEGEGPLSLDQSSEIANVVKQSPLLEKLSFAAENKLSVEAMCPLLTDAPPCLEVCSEGFDITYKKGEGGSLRLKLHRGFPLTGPLVQQVAQLIGAVQSLQRLEVVEAPQSEGAVTQSKESEVIVFPSEEVVEAITIGEFADSARVKGDRPQSEVNVAEFANFIRVCLTLKLVLSDGAPIRITTRMSRDLRFETSTTTPTDHLRAVYEGRRAAEPQSEPELRIAMTKWEAPPFGWLDLRELLDVCSLVLLAGSSPLTMEQCGPFVELHPPEAPRTRGDPHPELRTVHFIYECSTLEVMFNSAPEHQIKLTKDALKELRYEVKDKAVYDSARGGHLLIDSMRPHRIEKLRTYIHRIKSLRTVQFGNGTAQPVDECKQMASFIRSFGGDRESPRRHGVLPSFSLGGTLTILPFSAGEHEELWRFIYACFVLNDIFNYGVHTEEMTEEDLEAILGERKLGLDSRGEYSWGEPCTLLVEAPLAGRPAIGLAGCTHITRFASKSLTEVQQLQILKIGASNGIGPGGCAQLTMLGQLIELVIGDDNQIGSEGCQHIKELRKLQQLTIGGSNNISSGGCEHLTKLGKHLWYLDIGEKNNIQPEGCRYLHHFQVLQHLRLGASNELCPQGCRAIGSARLRQLCHLDLGADNGIGTEGCEWIGEVASLKTLKIGDRNDIRIKGCEYLVSLQGLTRLELGGDNRVHHEGCSWLQRIRELQHLEIGRRNEMAAEGCRHLKDLRHLQRLKIGEGNYITQVGCQHLQAIKTLQYLEIGSENDVDDAGIRCFAQLPHLRQIKIGGVDQKPAASLDAASPKRGLPINIDNEDKAWTQSTATGSSSSRSRRWTMGTSG